MGASVLPTRIGSAPGRSSPVRLLPLIVLPALYACAASPTVPSPQESLTDWLIEASSEAPVVVAHRGLSATHPENTLPAFEAAMRLGVQMIEFDVHETADGVLVCIHDETIDRTAGLDGGASGTAATGNEVASLPWSGGVDRLDVGAWKGAQFAGTPVPTLEAALLAMRGRTVPMIEHKAGSPARYVELLRRLDLVDQVVLQSFDWDFLRAVRALEPRLILGALGPTEQHSTLDAGALEAVKGIRPFMVHWSHKALDAASIQGIQRAGYWTCCYTVDDPRELRRIAADGIEAITINNPAILLELIRAGEL